MTVAELIEELKKMPQEMPVYYYWDSAVRSEVNYVYEGKYEFNLKYEPVVVISEEPKEE